VDTGVVSRTGANRSSPETAVPTGPAVDAPIALDDLPPNTDAACDRTDADDTALLPSHASRATHRPTAVGRRPPIDHQLPTVDRDDSDRVDVDREQIPVLGRLSATFGRQPRAKR
jgi:hypothetical protein